MKLMAKNIKSTPVEVELVGWYNSHSCEVKFQDHKFIVEHYDLQFVDFNKTKLHKTLVRLASEFVFACENRKLEIVKTKTTLNNIDDFNWLVDMFYGNLYDLDKDSEYYDEHNFIKQQFELL